MIILFVVLFAISIYGVRLSSFHENYISKDSTNAIKGIFALIILFSHIRGYLFFSDSFEDQSYIFLLNQIGQLMVAPYLFYSGFGIMESIKQDKNYGQSFFRRRIVKTLIHFDIAVFLYVILQSFLGKYYSLSIYLSSIIGWESVGNSNWFVFDILVLYFIVYLSYFCIYWHTRMKEDNRDNVEMVFLASIILLCIILWFFLYSTKKHSWWIDTIMTFPLGILYSQHKTWVETVLKNKKHYYAMLCLSICLFLFWRYSIGIDRIGICSCIFCLLMAIVSMKVKLDNKILQWLGTQAFAIYILQRLPMILYSKIGLNHNTILFVSLTIPSVLILSTIYTYFINKVDKFAIQK